MKETEATGPWAKRFDYNYLGSYMLTDGQKVNVTIKRITDAQGAKVQGENKDVTLMYFNEYDKPLILNKENAKILTWNFGTKELQNWIGKSAIMYADPNVKAFGAVVEALRFTKNPTRGVFSAGHTQAAPKRKVLDLNSPNYAEWSEWLGREGSTLAYICGKFDVTEAAKKELMKIKAE